MLSHGLLLSGMALLCSAAPQDPLDGWIKELKTRRDDAEVELIQKIAAHKSRKAMEALVASYDLMRSIYMRREVIRALSKFDGVTDAEQPAVEKIASVAGSTDDEDLREAAMEALGECKNLGKHFLRQIVASEADDRVRLLAMRHHTKRAAKDDVRWYRKVWNPKRELNKKGKKGVELLEFEPIRELAFSAAAKFLSDTDVVDAMRSAFNPKIRRAALEALNERDSPRTASMASWLFKRVDVPGAERIEAMKILAARQRGRIVPTLISLAKKQVVTQEDLRLAMAAQIVVLNDEAANKKVAKLIGRGKPHEKVFALRATTHLNDPKFLKRVRKGLRDKNQDVRTATAQVLGEREDRDSLDALRALLAKPREPEDMRVAIDAISMIEKSSGAWVKQLVQFCKHDVREVRNAALHELGKTRDPAHLPTLTEGLTHADWTTRLVSVHALEELRHKEAVPILIKRLAAEEGRMSRIVADTLWSLTGQPFEEDHKRWQSWWKDESSKFAVLTLDDLAKAEKERELRRLRQRTTVKAKFFGIRIESHRVIFIVDTSGSMTDPVHGRMVGKRQATRIDVAKEELSQSIENLAENSLFNIFAFSSGVGRWLKEGISTSSKQPRDNALEWVRRLGAGGATNLYDTVKLAFEDPDVDTIFILSDGEPTAGEEIDPHRIREGVKSWNKHRRIEIHTIAIGGNLDVLEWLAKDSGGDHVRIR